jgi:hypothetical protein
MLLLAGCGSGAVHKATPLPAPAWKELRDSAEQSLLTCGGDKVPRMSPRTERRECLEPTPEELNAAMRELNALCDRGSRLWGAQRFERCVKS